MENQLRHILGQEREWRTQGVAKTSPKTSPCFQEDMPFGKHQVSCEKFLGIVYQIIDFHGLVLPASLTVVHERNLSENICGKDWLPGAQIAFPKSSKQIQLTRFAYSIFLHKVCPTLPQLFRVLFTGGCVW